MVSSKHNQIQQDCTNPDSEREFVLGEIYGLRQWHLGLGYAQHTPPYLYGHRGYKWDLSDVNVAECGIVKTNVNETLSISAFAAAEARDEFLLLLVEQLREFVNKHPAASNISVSALPVRSLLGYRTMKVSQFLLESPQSYPDALPWKIERTGSTFSVNGAETPYAHLDFRVTAEIPPEPHDVTDPKCTCGFYAYTSPRALYANSTGGSPEVFGVIKGYGKATLGTKGFRIEKAEIVALTVPQTRTSIPYGAGTSRHNWIKSEQPDVQDTFRFFVPDSIPVHNTLDDLLTAASHLIKPPEGETL